MKLTKKRILVGMMTFALAIVLVMPTFVMAQGTDELDCTEEGVCACGVGYEPQAGSTGVGCECLATDGSATIQLQPCLPTSDYTNDDMDLMTTIVQLINIIMSFLGFIAVIIILIGGFKWMTAQGDDKKVEDAKKTITTGVIGLVVIFAAWGVARFVINLLANL
ncbi:MAG: pilin [Patescibacteria group bacterium]